MTLRHARRSSRDRVGAHDQARRHRSGHRPPQGSHRGFDHPPDELEQSLLYLLAGRAGRVVTRDGMLGAIWGTDFLAEGDIVDRHIRSLRINLQNDYRHPRFIATVPGQGYRFIPTFSNQGWASGWESHPPND